MATFILAFLLLLLIVAGMAVGAIFKGRTITGSCGGLNAATGSKTCAICNQPVDPDTPLRARIHGNGPPDLRRL